MTFSEKLNALSSDASRHTPTQDDIEELESYYRTEILGWAHAVDKNPADFLRNANAVKDRTVSLLNDILQHQKFFLTHVGQLTAVIENGLSREEVEKIQLQRLWFMDVGNIINDALSVLFDLLLSNFSEYRTNEKVAEIAKQYLPINKRYLVTNGDRPKNTENTDTGELTHPQKSLLMFYNNEEPDANAPLKLRNTFRDLSRPGKSGEIERRKLGASRSSLRRRLDDFEAIRPLIKPEGLAKFSEDEKAVLDEYEGFKS